MILNTNVATLNSKWINKISLFVAVHKLKSVFIYSFKWAYKSACSTMTRQKSFSMRINFSFSFFNNHVVSCMLCSIVILVAMKNHLLNFRGEKCQKH